MNRLLKYDEWLFAAVLALVLCGVVMVYSASAFVAMDEGANQFGYVMRQAVWAVLGCAALAVGMRVDYRQWRDKRIVYGLLGLVVVLLCAVFGFRAINGAQRWIRIGIFSIQPSEFAKIALLLFIARFLELRAGEEHRFLKTVMPCVGVTGLLVILIVGEPDLGTAIMLLVACGAMLFAAGARLSQLALLAMPVVVGIIGLLVFVPFRMRRIASFLDPFADREGAGYQVVQSLIAVGSGGVSGVGFAEGKQKMLFLPFAHSDFIFAVIGEELGLIGCLLVLVAFGVVLWRGVEASLHAPDRFGKLLGLGIVTTIIAQALFNISVVTALLPTKGIPLPFISYGGSSLLPMMFATGVLLNISAQSRANDYKLASRSRWF